MDVWRRKLYNLTGLHVYVCWEVRKICKRYIFEDIKPSSSSIITRIECFMSLYPVPLKSVKRRQIGTRPYLSYPAGFFDGAAKNNIGGAGYTIFLNDTHYFFFSVGCGQSTNTRAELLALWSILRTCLLMGLPMNQIFGDSMAIISWVNRISNLDVPNLIHWREDILSMLRLVPPVSINHTYREHNTLADGLSKKALLLDMGHGYYYESMDGLVLGEGHFTLF